MNRCVVIHRTGITEVQDVPPEVHRHLRSLGYQRFVMNFVRGEGGQPSSSAIYAPAVPTAWQVTDAARQLWGRTRGAVRVFDEQGRALQFDALPSRPTTPISSDVVDDDARAAAPTAPSPSQRVEVGARAPVIIEPDAVTARVPALRVTAIPSRGWVVEVRSAPAGSTEEWKEVLIVPPASTPGGGAP